jgi:hypothetical protein
MFRSPASVAGVDRTSRHREVSPRGPPLPRGTPAGGLPKAPRASRGPTTRA